MACIYKYIMVNSIMCPVCISIRVYKICSVPCIWVYGCDSIGVWVLDYGVESAVYGCKGGASPGQTFTPSHPM